MTPHWVVILVNRRCWWETDRIGGRLGGRGRKKNKGEAESERRRGLTLLSLSLSHRWRRTDAQSFYMSHGRKPPFDRFWIYNYWTLRNQFDQPWDWAGPLDSWILEVVGTWGLWDVGKSPELRWLALHLILHLRNSTITELPLMVMPKPENVARITDIMACMWICRFRSRNIDTTSKAL